MDLIAASKFMTTHGRLLDRRRLDLVTGRARADDVLTALAAYRNPDGGFGWGLEPDLRSPESQPAGALHALEVFEETGSHPFAARLCDWLASVTLPDGGLPFALPVTEPAGCAPFWVQADPTASALHLTTAIVAMAHRVAAHDPAVRDHGWLARATEYCRREIAALNEPRHAYEFRFVLWFLDAVNDVAELQRLGKHLPADGTMPVEGGIEGETFHPLDFSPLPDRPLRDLLAPEVIRADLDRLAALQQDDGGWVVNFASRSPAGALEWRGYATVQAVTMLRAH